MKLSKKKLLTLMAMCSEVYRQETTENLTEVYWQILSGYEEQDVTRAFNHHLSHSKFFPKPSEILDQLRGDPETLAIIALRDMNQALDRNGVYKSFRFSDPYLNVLIDDFYGGWNRFAEAAHNMTMNDWKFFEKDFMKNYKTYLTRPLPDEIPRMIGFFEIDNQSKGYLTDDTGHAIRQDGELLIAGTEKVKAYLEAQNQKQLAGPDARKN